VSPADRTPQRKPQPGDPPVSFGPFRLYPARQLLFKAERAVPLGGRALDILVALTERAGELVTKRELVSRVWPDLFVGEGNLRMQVALLRRALGDGRGGARYVATVAGRGYRFVAQVSSPLVPPNEQAVAAPPRPNLPHRLGRLIGRAQALAELRNVLLHNRFLTIAGAGGIGKTSLALALAGELSPLYPDGVYFVDLAGISNPDLVASTVAVALGLHVAEGMATQAMRTFLRQRQVLLVLDCCEHVVQGAAVVAESLLSHTTQMRVLATSREPLRAEGELVHRLPPLAVPDAAEVLTAADALKYPAIELFMERVTANVSSYTLTDEDAPMVGGICRKLDGIALAIELAAGRVEALGMQELASLIDDRFRLVMQGRRTASRRHQTLGAVLDWSYETLSSNERAALRRLGVFCGTFTLQCAQSLCADMELDGEGVFEIVASLVSKSLISVDAGTTPQLYRLLDSTRAYARAKLIEADELDAVARRHALYLIDRLQGDETGVRIEEVRSALRWAFSPTGDCRTAVALTVNSLPLWLLASLYQEGRRCIEHALACLEQTGDDSRTEMRLCAALGAVLTQISNGAENAESAWTRALQLARDLSDVDCELRSLWGLWSCRFNRGDLRRALEAGEQFRATALRSREPADAVMGERLLGLAQFHLGNLSAARTHLESMLKHYVVRANHAHIVRFQYDPRVAARSLLGTILWTQGFPERAAREVQRAIEEARAVNHAASEALALERGCQVALLLGDLPAAEGAIGRLIAHSDKHALELWRTRAGGFRGMLRVALGDPHGGIRELARTIEGCPSKDFHARHLSLLAGLAHALGIVGDTTEALAIVDGALGHAKHDDGRWYFPEFLWIKGELLRRRGEPGDLATAEEVIAHAVQWARRQEALSWELRATISLARVLRAGGHGSDARAALMSVRGRFTEGFASADLLAAEALIRELHSAP